MEAVLYWAAVVVLIQYILNPVLLRLRYRAFLEPRVEQIPIESLPAEVKSHFDAAAADFQATGFVPCAVARTTNPDGSGEIFSFLWFNWNEGISGYATIAYRRMPNGIPKLFSKSVALVTRFSETSQFETTTSRLPTPLARMPLRPVIKLPNLGGLVKLLPVHIALANQFHPGKERLLPAKGQELAMMCRKMAEIHAHQIKAGRWELDSSGALCHLTWKGAIINGWQYSWPVNSVRKWQVRKDAKRILASLNLSPN
ncbi:MAG TPA: hypothetical protein VN048_20150 [Verrucomicrobiae bacterium]|jgi:hypothetical protein|nr:hypothetical protein [Verrucomicrobiae bacterium]